MANTDGDGHRREFRCGLLSAMVWHVCVLVIIVLPWAVDPGSSSFDVFGSGYTGWGLALSLAFFATSVATDIAVLLHRSPMAPLVPLLRSLRTRLFFLNFSSSTCIGFGFWFLLVPIYGGGDAFHQGLSSWGDWSNVIVHGFTSVAMWIELLVTYREPSPAAEHVSAATVFAASYLFADGLARLTTGAWAYGFEEGAFPAICVVFIAGHWITSFLGLAITSRINRFRQTRRAWGPVKTASAASSGVSLGQPLVPDLEFAAGSATVVPATSSPPPTAPGTTAGPSSPVPRAMRAVRAALAPWPVFVLVVMGTLVLSATLDALATRWQYPLLAQVAFEASNATDTLQLLRDATSLRSQSGAIGHIPLLVGGAGEMQSLVVLPHPDLSSGPAPPALSLVLRASLLPSSGAGGATPTRTSTWEPVTKGVGGPPLNLINATSCFPDADAIPTCGMTVDTPGGPRTVVFFRGERRDFFRSTAGAGVAVVSNLTGGVPGAVSARVAACAQAEAGEPQLPLSVVGLGGRAYFFLLRKDAGAEIGNGVVVGSIDATEQALAAFPLPLVFFDGETFGATSIDGAAPIVSGNGLNLDGVSVAYMAYLGRYAMLIAEPISRTLEVRTAPAPQGPWSDASPLLTLPGDLGENFLGAVKHAQWLPLLFRDGGREAVLTFHVNGEDMPHFVRVTASLQGPRPFYNPEHPTRL